MRGRSRELWPRPCAQAPSLPVSVPDDGQEATRLGAHKAGLAGRDEAVLEEGAELALELGQREQVAQGLDLLAEAGLGGHALDGADKVDEQNVRAGGALGKVRMFTCQLVALSVVLALERMRTSAPWWPRQCRRRWRQRRT